VNKKAKTPQYGGYELGKTYFSNYWRKKFTVIQLHDKLGWMDWAVTVLWEDGSITTHCTPFGKRDYEIVSA
jgi:hypothetical protein